MENYKLKDMPKAHLILLFKSYNMEDEISNVANMGAVFSRYLDVQEFPRAGRNYVKLMNTETHGEIVKGNTTIPMKERIKRHNYSCITKQGAIVNHVGGLLRNSQESGNTTIPIDIVYFCPTVKRGEMLRFLCRFSSIIRSTFCSGMSRIDFDTVCGGHSGGSYELIISE
jgi:hypothetical protein